MNTADTFGFQPGSNNLYADITTIVPTVASALLLRGATLPLSFSDANDAFLSNVTTAKRFLPLLIPLVIIIGAGAAAAGTVSVIGIHQAVSGNNDEVAVAVQTEREPVDCSVDPTKKRAQPSYCPQKDAEIAFFGHSSLRSFITISKVAIKIANNRPRYDTGKFSNWVIFTGNWLTTEFTVGQSIHDDQHCLTILDRPFSSMLDTGLDRQALH
jgi:uncharacterized protein YceK